MHATDQDQATAGSTAGAVRLEPLDALRGLAMLWMAIYHFNFDLNALGFIQPKLRFFVEPFWAMQRIAILSMFLFAAGAALAVGLHRHQPWGAFLRRWLQIVAGAALVSLASWWMDPKSWIWFGVLHAMAVMLLLSRLLGRWPAWLLSGVAALMLALPQVLSFEHAAWPWLRWLGLSGKPITQDWVPLFPWLAVMLLGLVAGRLLLAHRPVWLNWRVSDWAQPLVTLGRWSLAFYLLHQPVFYGALWVVARASQ